MKGGWLFQYIKNYPRLRSIKHNYVNPTPAHLIILITENCNSRCLICNFWKKKSRNELTINEISTFLSSPLLQNLKSVTISGGEPLLRKDLIEIINMIYNKTCIKVSLNTNGLLPQVLEKLLLVHRNKIDNILLSIDGPKEINNKIRGNRTFERVLKSIKIAEKYGLCPCVNTTLTKLNFKSLGETYLQFKDYHFSFKLAQNSRFYFGNNSETPFNFSDNEAKELVKIVKRLPQNDLYTLFMPKWIQNRTRPSPCYAGSFSLVLGAHGEISLCIHSAPIGNIRKNLFDSIWTSKEMQHFRKQNRTCQLCYERCTTDTFHIDLPKWVLIKSILTFKRRIHQLFASKNQFT